MLKLEQLPAWLSSKIRCKKVFLEAQREKSPLCLSFFFFFFQNGEVDPMYQKDKGLVVPRDVVAKDDPGSYSLFIEQGSSTSQKTTEKIMDVIARRPK